MRLLVGLMLVLAQWLAVTGALQAGTPRSLSRADPLDDAIAAPYCALAPLGASERAGLERAAQDRTSAAAMQRAVATVQLAGYAIAAAQRSPRDCERALERGQQRFARELARQARDVTGNATKADAADPAIREVQQQLRDAWIADQASRRAYQELATDDRTGANYWARSLALGYGIRLDAVNTELIRTLLTRHDWIDGGRFGARAASHAWLLVQHADADPAFQKMALARMEPYLESGGVDRRDYAYLFDRVAVNTGGLQRYGTQPRSQCNADGSLSPQPLEDPAQVDARRAQMGMEPMAEAMADMASRRCRAGRTEEG